MSGGELSNRLRAPNCPHPNYLDGFGKPATLEELRTHRIVEHIGYAPVASLESWHTFVARHPHVVYRPNTTGSFLAAVRAGYGIGLFPNFYCIVAPDLVRLELEMSAAAPVWLFAHEETSRNARVRSVFDFLIHRFRRDRRAWFS
jgi:DNA-binding transcriptional LysR family regulator